jgi:acylpyruvate hydrolase
VRLATIRTSEGTRAVRLDGDVLVDVGAPDVGELLGHADWAERARATPVRLTTAGGEPALVLAPWL